MTEQLEETNESIRNTLVLVNGLMEQNKEMKDLLSDFKSMFTDGKSDLYLSMINNLKTEIK
jgi:translation initiation factor 1 (eIF-1/SUI1)